MILIYLFIVILLSPLCFTPCDGYDRVCAFCSVINWLFPLQLDDSLEKLIRGHWFPSAQSTS